MEKLVWKSVPCDSFWFPFFNHCHCHGFPSLHLHPLAPWSSPWVLISLCRLYLHIFNSKSCLFFSFLESSLCQYKDYCQIRLHYRKMPQENSLCIKKDCFVKRLWHFSQLPALEVSCFSWMWLCGELFQVPPPRELLWGARWLRMIKSLRIMTSGMPNI